MAVKMQIRVIESGPYRVSGGIPLKEMAPVQTLNGEPIAWHTLGDVTTAAESYDLCRCGRSKTKPFCDDACQKPPFNGKETASRESFRHRTQEWTHGDEVLADDKALCIQAGFCGTRTEKVWGMFEDSDPVRREKMRGMVWRCPSGRIVLYGADGFSEDPTLPQEIAVVPGGPLWVRGGVELVGELGEPWEPRNRMTLCRCGSSRNKPFCDGTHAMIHFDER